MIRNTADITNGEEDITVTGGVNNSPDCVATVNLCVTQGNEYRAAPAQVNAEVWMSFINGANGIEYFCHDLTSTSYCLGDWAGGLGARASQANLTYINQTVLSYAPVLNSPTVGMCSMQQEAYSTGQLSTANSCSNGVLKMATSDAAMPGMALAKKVGAVFYLLAQSDRRRPSGAQFKFSLQGMGSKHANIVYNLDARYDPGNSTVGRSIALNGTGEFTDLFGAHHDDYQVKIYLIQ